MEATALPIFRDQLLDRRQKLATAAATSSEAHDVTRLLQEVDAALRRMDAGSYGICETCGDPARPEGGRRCAVRRGQPPFGLIMLATQP
jgi:RNA polymerase-binding transcription factor DksA